MDKINRALLGLGLCVIAVGLFSRPDPTPPSKLRMTSSESTIRPSVNAKTDSPPPTNFVPAPIARASSYEQRLSKWIQDSRHTHDDVRSFASRKIIAKFNLRSAKYLKMSKDDQQLIFENRGSSTTLHFCDHSGVELKRLMDTGASGTFYFQEGHSVSLSSIRNVPFCSITLRKNVSATDNFNLFYMVLEKKVDFRLLPKFTGVRFWFDNSSKEDVVQEISCYTPVIDPKNFDYDSLSKKDMAYAFYTLLDVY